MADDSVGVVAHPSTAESFALQSEASDAPLFRAPGRKFLGLRHQPSRIASAILGLLGAAMFVGVWEGAHYLTPEEGRQFLPSVEEVIYALIDLFREQDFLDDVIASCIRIFVSFFAAAAVAIPLGVLMGCFKNLRALLNPTISGWRYLPAASFMPLLLVWFGPTETAKLALLFIGVVFFLTALILDNAEAVPGNSSRRPSRWERAGGSRHDVVVPAAAPAMFDSMRNMIAVGWTYLVIAEIVGAQDGIGAMMMRAGRSLSVE